jgi:hypothetical protein
MKGAGEYLASSLKSAFGDSLTALRPLDGGTLSLCFVGELQGQTRFFKTHAVSAGRVTLQREAAILESTAEDRADVRLLKLQHGDQERIWLHMKSLRPCAALSPAMARDLVDSFEGPLAAIADYGLVPETDNIKLLLTEAETALEELSTQGLLSQVVQDKAQTCVARCNAHCADWSVQLCHGDLGPANIMTEGQDPLVVDWEDAFWGIPGYDYLYWLTFFNNRQWLLPEALGYTPIGRTNEVSLMVVILLLKSLLSVRNGSFRDNSVSLDARILEVLNLPTKPSCMLKLILECFVLN